MELNFRVAAAGLPIGLAKGATAAAMMDMCTSIASVEVALLPEQEQPK